jgi:hypothetical protein
MARTKSQPGSSGKKAPPASPQQKSGKGSVKKGKKVLPIRQVREDPGNDHSTGSNAGEDDSEESSQSTSLTVAPAAASDSKKAKRRRRHAENNMASPDNSPRSGANDSQEEDSPASTDDGHNVLSSRSAKRQKRGKSSVPAYDTSEAVRDDGLRRGDDEDDYGDDAEHVGSQQDEDRYTYEDEDSDFDISESYDPAPSHAENSPTARSSNKSEPSQTAQEIARIILEPMYDRCVGDPFDLAALAEFYKHAAKIHQKHPEVKIPRLPMDSGNREVDNQKKHTTRQIDYVRSSRANTSAGRASQNDNARSSSSRANRANSFPPSDHFSSMPSTSRTATSYGGGRLPDNREAAHGHEPSPEQLFRKDANGNYVAVGGSVNNSQTDFRSDDRSIGGRSYSIDDDNAEYHGSFMLPAKKPFDTVGQFATAGNIGSLSRDPRRSANLGGPDILSTLRLYSRGSRFQSDVPDDSGSIDGNYDGLEGRGSYSYGTGAVGIETPDLIRAALAPSSVGLGRFSEASFDRTGHETAQVLRPFRHVEKKSKGLPPLTVKLECGSRFLEGALDNYIIILDNVLLLKDKIREAVELARDDAVAFCRKSPQTAEITNHLGDFFLEQIEDVLSAAGANSTEQSIINSLWEISFDQPGTNHGALIAVHYLKSSKTAMAVLATAAGGRNPRITNDADAPGMDKSDAVKLSQAEKKARKRLRQQEAKSNGAKPTTIAGGQQQSDRNSGPCPFWCSTVGCNLSKKRSKSACNPARHAFPTTPADRTSCLALMSRFNLTAVPDFPAEDAL